MTREWKADAENLRDVERGISRHGDAGWVVCHRKLMLSEAITFPGP